VQGADISKIIAGLKALKGGAAPARGEFETAEAFEARIQAVPENLKKPMVFPVVLGEGTIRYDADQQRVFIDLPMDTHVLGPTSINTIGMRRVFTTQPSYVASNAFGVTKPISRGLMEERGIAIQAASLFGLSFEMEPSRAEKIKPLLCLAVQGVIDRAVVYSVEERHAPTMAEPKDTTITGEYVSVFAWYVLAIDIRDGSIVATVPLQRSPAEISAARAGAGQVSLPAGVHRIEYRLDGSARTVGATYRNATGGTEQKDVGLPAGMTFFAATGSFAYVSAQNQGDSGEVHVAVLVDGRILQEATSSTAYGIATASGRVP
jgi:hypothetical protein